MPNPAFPGLGMLLRGSSFGLGEADSLDKEGVFKTLNPTEEASDGGGRIPGFVTGLGIPPGGGGGGIPAGEVGNVSACFITPGGGGIAPNGGGTAPTIPKGGGTTPRGGAGAADVAAEGGGEGERELELLILALLRERSSCLN